MAHPIPVKSTVNRLTRGRLLGMIECLSGGYGEFFSRDSDRVPTGLGADGRSVFEG